MLLLTFFSLPFKHDKTLDVFTPPLKHSAYRVLHIVLLSAASVRKIRNYYSPEVTLKNNA